VLSAIDLPSPLDFEDGISCIVCCPRSWNGRISQIKCSYQQIFVYSDMRLRLGLATGCARDMQSSLREGKSGASDASVHPIVTSRTKIDRSRYRIATTMATDIGRLLVAVPVVLSVMHQLHTA
jgi:hypothetical protein